MPPIRLVLALVLGSSSALASSNRSGIEVSDAYASATSAGQTTANVYMTLTSLAGDTLLRVTSPSAAQATVRQLLIRGGQIAFRPVTEGYFLARGQTVRFTPEHSYIELSGLAAPLTAGTSIAVRLTFARAGEVSLAVPVKAEQP